jgi:hypothetical protein
MTKFLKFYLSLFLSAILIVGSVGYWQFNKTETAEAAGCAGTGNCYWVGGSGNANDTNHWATTSGGATKGGLPTSADNCNFDANSFSAGNATITLPTTINLNCKDMDWTGATNTPTVQDACDGTNNYYIYGNVTIISALNLYICGPFNMQATSGTKTITSNGGTFGGGLVVGNAGAGATFNLADAIIGLSSVVNGTFNSNNYSIASQILGFSGGTVNLGTSTVTINYSGSNSTANSNKFIISGGAVNASSASFVMNSTATYGSTFTGNGNTFGSLTIAGNGVNTVTIVGNNTFGTLTVDRSQAAKTVKFTNSSTQTVTNFTSPLNGTTVTTIANTSGTTVANLVKAGGGTISLDYLAISYSSSSPASTWYAGTHSTNTAGNSGWIFTDIPQIIPLAPQQVITKNASTIIKSASMTIKAQ